MRFIIMDLPSVGIKGIRADRIGRLYEGGQAYRYPSTGRCA